jgi:quercetin dioxygenase-like cupin family protein
MVATSASSAANKESQMRFAFLSVALLASACVSVNANVTTTPDATLLAVQNARVRECPPERTQANARTEGFGAQAGVVGEDIALAPVASDPTRAVRLRRLTIAPGGVIAWHDHTAVQGMALMVSGEMVELRNSCLDPITYQPAIPRINASPSPLRRGG